MKLKNKSSCNDLRPSKQRMKKHQSLTLNKWVHFQCRLLAGLQSSGSTTITSLIPSERVNFHTPHPSDDGRGENFRNYYFPELILPNISSKVRTCDTVITCFFLALPTKPCIYFSHSLVHGQVNESTAQAKMWQDKQHIFQCFIKLQQRL